MNIVNLISFLEIAGGDVDLCGDLKPVLRLVGYVVLGIKIVVPIILIIVGMLDLAKAVTEKSEDKIKAAQNGLVKKAIAAACVFLIATIVGLLMNLIGDDSYEDCWKCINSPSSCK